MQTETSSPYSIVGHNDAERKASIEGVCYSVAAATAKYAAYTRNTPVRRQLTQSQFV